jgi:hypothetical protein
LRLTDATVAIAVIDKNGPGKVLSGCEKRLNTAIPDIAILTFRNGQYMKHNSETQDGRTKNTTRTGGLSRRE